MISIFSFTAEGSNPLKKYQWKNRIIIITGEKESEVLYKKFLAQHEQLENRDLILLYINEHGNQFFPASLQKEVVEKPILHYYSLETYKNELILIGKDGGIKWRKGNLADPAEIFDLIDSMPMRQSEMRKKNN
jgi:hypothetical protein